MDKLERLAYWKNVAVDAVRAAGREGADELKAAVFKNEDDLFAFFDCFRPDGAGLEKVFAGVVAGAEILQRLRRVYELKEPPTAFGYFVVRRPIPATIERLVELTTQHLLNVKQIAINFGEAKLASLLEPLPAIEAECARVPTPSLSDYANMPEASVNDIVGDWFAGLVPVQSDALMLHEAFYSIACDYKIAHYLMWPLYRRSTEIEEPFAPYFELWTHGARPFFEKVGLVTVYLTGDNSTPGKAVAEC